MKDHSVAPLPQPSVEGPAERGGEPGGRLHAPPQVARLDAQTPRKEVEEPVGVVRVDSMTPRVGPEKVKAKQRKLYD